MKQRRNLTREEREMRRNERYALVLILATLACSAGFWLAFQRMAALGAWS